MFDSKSMFASYNSDGRRFVNAIIEDRHAARLTRFAKLGFLDIERSWCSNESRCQISSSELTLAVSLLCSFIIKKRSFYGNDWLITNNGIFAAVQASLAVVCEDVFSISDNQLPMRMCSISEFKNCFVEN